MSTRLFNVLATLLASSLLVFGSAALAGPPAC
jgi:hypothetical protein